MGSGYSACTGPASVSVVDKAGFQNSDRKNSERVLSDSCDSGISLGSRNRRSSASTEHSKTARELQNSRVRDRRDNSEDDEEDGVAGSDVACGTEITYTPRPDDVKPFPLHKVVEDDKDEKTSRKERSHSRTDVNTLRHNPRSAPNLLDHAIHEEDEEASNGEPEDKRMRAQQRPPRPKSAHFRKSRAQTSRARTAKSRKTVSGTGSTSGGESTEDLSSDDDNAFDSDILSIPDETGDLRLNALTTVKLGTKFHANDNTATASAPNFKKGHHDYEEDMEWWSDDGGSHRYDGSDTARSRAERRRLGSFSWNSSRMSKKASERSISSILLITAVEVDSHATAVTNPACFSVTNPEITRHILQCLQEMEQELRASCMALAAQPRAGLSSYIHVVTSLRPRFLRLLGDFMLACSEPIGRLPIECESIIQLEEEFAQHLMELNATTTGQLEFSPLVSKHLQDLEELCKREAIFTPRTLHLRSQADRYPMAFWDESGVDDEFDLMEDDLHTNGRLLTVDPLSRNFDTDSATEDNLSEKEKNDRHNKMSGLTSLPPRGSVKSARPPSLASSMNTARTSSSARRPATDRSLPSISTVKAVTEKEGRGADAPISTCKPASNGGRNDSTEKGDNSGRKSRPDSGIVVSSCSTSCSSSDTTRETDADQLAAQTEWIAKSLEMLESILQVRTESHETIKSLVAAITVGSTSDQLKAHALYRWLASQNMMYYAKCTSAKPATPTDKLRQLAEKKTCYAVLYQEMASAAGLECEIIEGFAKGPDYRPGIPVVGADNSHKHSWNAVKLDGHYHFLDPGFGALPCKFFVEHFFLTPPDEMRLSHFPREKRWLLMTQCLSMDDFEGTLKTWPAMFAFNIRPLNMKSVLRSYDGHLSITVLLRNVAVTPQLEYVGPGKPLDADTLAFNIDQEIRNVDNAETFHLNLPEEGVYYFTLMVHDLEEDEDIPAFQYRVVFKDELL